MDIAENNGKTCIFTIVSNNYLHYANTLFESVKEHCPEASLVLGLCDKSVDDTFCPGAEVIELLDLDIEHISRFIYQYTILELNTAIKPYVIECLMNQGYEKVIYFDPDIKLFGSIQPMLDMLDDHNVLLTPHLTNLLDDGLLPNELGILQAGSYNLGYIGLANSEESLKLVKWWQSKLYRECVVDISRGLFVDQKWMDMAPSLFDGVHICRDDGWNVAYWNLNHREVIKCGENEFEVNGRPLMFFHFSGYSIEAKTLSKHQNRFDKTSNGLAVIELCEIYNDCLTRNGIGKFKNLDYAYNHFIDGTVVPEAARLLIKDESFFDNIDLFSDADLQQAYDFLNQYVAASKGAMLRVTRIAEKLWKSREDLQVAFPNIYGADAHRFLDWVSQVASKESKFSSVFTDKITADLQALTEQRVFVSEAQQDVSLTDSLIKKLWLKREKIPLSIRLALGQPVANWAFNRAFGATSVVPANTFGINLIGYVHAESGVGEAARSSIRGIEYENIPLDIVDYRVGNVSRMSESVSLNTVETGSYPINLVHVNADQSGVVRDSLPTEVFDNKYNIGYWYWEMPEFPDFLNFAFDNVDEVWVATKYVYEAVSAKTNKPVNLIPPNVNVQLNSGKTRTDFGLSDEDFVFFHSSDVLSMTERKNPLAVLEAFKQAFPVNSKAQVKLVMKLSNLNHNPEIEKQVNELVANDDRIILMFCYLDRLDLNALLNNIDCYVSLHRSEGFGLPIAEAMSLGKVVIATMWSGNTDFMTDENSLPVAFTLETLEKDIGPYLKGQTWANPIIADAAEKMFHVSQDKMLCKSLGDAAADTISSHFSPSVSGKAINKRLHEIFGGEK